MKRKDTLACGAGVICADREFLAEIATLSKVDCARQLFINPARRWMTSGHEV